MKKAGTTFITPEILSLRKTALTSIPSVQSRSARYFGIEEYTDEILPEIGGPDIHDYVKEISLPEDFTLDLTVRDIIGTLPEDQSTAPEIPEDIKKAYEDAMAENGLSTEEGAYDNFTEEQKDMEHRLFTEMWNAYYERYPEAADRAMNMRTGFWMENGSLRLM